MNPAQVVDRFFTEVWNRRQLAVLDEIINPACVTGAWQGVPSTGREVTIRTVARHRVENGRIIEDWVIVETLGLFQQLGLVQPTPDLVMPSRGGAP